MPQQFRDLTSSINLVLYPDATITGTVTGSNGQPMVKVPVAILRDSPNATPDRFTPMGSTQTNTRGEYRFEQPPGRYRIHLGYSPNGTEIGEAMLPLDYPAQGAEGKTGAFAVGPGEERRVDLQPRTSLAYAVDFRADVDAGGGGVQMLVETCDGSRFAMYAQPTRVHGEFRLELPSGSYQLQGMISNRERASEADSKITVAGKPVGGLVLHFATVPSIPVELTIDPAPNAGSQSQGASSLGPEISQFSLTLQPSGRYEEIGQNYNSLRLRGDRIGQFQATSGVYRLRGQDGDWYIKGASYGSTNLLVVAPGAGGEPIRIVASNVSGEITGAVSAGGQSATGIFYVVAHQPSMNPVRMLRVSSGTYGTRLPPGSYAVVAFAHAFDGDLSDPAVVATLTGAETVEVSAGGTAMANLTVQPEGTLP